MLLLLCWLLLLLFDFSTKLNINKKFRENDPDRHVMILQQSATFERKSDGAIAIQCSVCFFSGFSTCHCSTNVSSSTTSSSSSASSTSSKAGNSSKIPAQNTPHQPPSKRGQGGSGSSGDRNTSGSSRIQLKKCDDKLEDNSNASAAAAAATASITGTTSTDKAEVVTSEVLEELAALRPGNNIFFSSSPPKTIWRDIFVLFCTFAAASLQERDVYLMKRIWNKFSLALSSAKKSSVVNFFWKNCFVFFLFVFLIC